MRWGGMGWRWSKEPVLTTLARASCGGKEGESISDVNEIARKIELLTVGFFFVERGEGRVKSREGFYDGISARCLILRSNLSSWLLRVYVALTRPDAGQQTTLFIINLNGL